MDGVHLAFKIIKLLRANVFLLTKTQLLILTVKIKQKTELVLHVENTINSTMENVNQLEIILNVIVGIAKENVNAAIIIINITLTITIFVKEEMTTVSNSIHKMENVHHVMKIMSYKMDNAT